MAAPAGPDASVRPARPADAAHVARLQAAAWHGSYAGSLPPDVLAALGPDALEPVWREGVRRPPTPRHHVLVAVAGEEVVGFAALGPAEDPDLDPASCGEVLALAVEPAARGQGHGSRLLQAAVDLLVEGGTAEVVAWVGQAERDLTHFLAGAGWAEDGALRSLDVRGDGSVPLPQHRLRSRLTEHR